MAEDPSEQTSPRKSVRREHSPPDGGYGWVIVVCVLMMQLFFVGTMNMYSVYLYDWTNYLQTSQAAMGVLWSLDTVLSSVTGRAANICGVCFYHINRIPP